MSTSSGLNSYSASPILPVYKVQKKSKGKYIWGLSL
jgi:hypothetical protein